MGRNKERKTEYKRKYDGGNKQKGYIRKKGDEMEQRLKMDVISNEDQNEANTIKENNDVHKKPKLNIVQINHRNTQHNEKKDYSTWSAAKINGKAEKYRKHTFRFDDDESDHYHLYDSGYGEDDFDDDDDDDDDDEDDQDDIRQDYKMPTYNKTSTPSWMFQRAKNREDARKEEKKSDWMFDRANDRKKFHDLNAAEWHTRKSVNKYCTKDDEGEESCENIEQLNVASINH